MALIKCSECGKEISDQAEVCPNCGVKTQVGKANQDAKEEEKKLNAFSIGVIVCVIIGIILLFSSLFTIFENLDKYGYLLKYGWADFFDVISIGDLIKLTLGISLIYGGLVSQRTAKEQIYQKTQSKTWKCPNCGKDNPLNFSFCTSCSCKKPRPKSVSNIWVCKKCGTENSNSLRYCSKCGSNKPVEINRQVWTCPDCGKSNIGIYNTCQGCGSSRPRNTPLTSAPTQTTSPTQETSPTARSEAPSVTPQQSSSTHKFCSNCGEKLQDGVKFCPNCGNRTDGSTASSAASQDYIGQATDIMRKAANSAMQKGTEAVDKVKDYIGSKRQ